MNRDKQNNPFNKFNSTLKNMNTETFKERKKTLEEFYKQRLQFNISNIEIIQVEPEINIYSNIDSIHFKTYITFTKDMFLMGNLYSNLKPIIHYALSYTILRKFYSVCFTLIEDNTAINYNYKYIDNELYVKDLEVILMTHYDFYDVDYDLYFNVLAELEQNNELIVSHTEPIPEKPKVINLFKIFKSDECIICLTNEPNILFCNCGHIPICTECYKLKSLSTCPICKTENEIIRMLE